LEIHNCKDYGLVVNCGFSGEHSFWKTCPPLCIPKLSAVRPSVGRVEKVGRHLNSSRRFERVGVDELFDAYLRGTSEMVRAIWTDK
jgi:hypothetical protein